MPHSVPVLSRISQYHLILTQYHQVPTILLYYTDPVHSFIISKRTVEPTGSSTFLLFLLSSSTPPKNIILPQILFPFFFLFLLGFSFPEMT